MKTLADFEYYVGIPSEPLQNLVVIAICKQCAFSMSFYDNDKTPLNIAGAVAQHTCYHKLVSIPQVVVE